MQFLGITNGRTEATSDSGIQDAKKFTSTSQQTLQGNTPVSSQDKVSLGVKAASPDGTSLDTVTLSTSQSEARLRSIRNRIDQGTYQISSYDLAEALIKKGVFTAKDL